MQWRTNLGLVWRVMKSNSYLYAVFLAAFMASPAMGYLYKVNCDGISFTATSITSVFGEARKAGAQRVGPFPASVVRFHKGVDVADCGEGEFVFPIEAGTIPSITFTWMPAIF